MLLDNKIATLLSQEDTEMNLICDKIIQALSNDGKASTRNFLSIEMLYHLLNQPFTQIYINLELYKKLNHLLELFASIVVINPTEPLVPSTPDITTSTISLVFGNVTVDEESVLYFDISGEYLTTILGISAPSKYTISVDPVYNFVNSLGLIPNVNKEITTTRIYVKYSPTAAETNNGNIVITSTGVTTNIACSGTGTI